MADDNKQAGLTPQRTGMLARIGNGFRAAFASVPTTTPPTDKLAGVDSTWERMDSYYGVRTASKNTVNEQSVNGIPASYACISLLANLVGSLPSRVIRRTAEGHQDLDGHPVTRLLTTLPNNFQTPMEFRRLMQSRVGGAGVAFARVRRDGRGRPISLVPLAGNRVQVLTDKDNEQIFYRIANADGTVETLTRFDMVQVNALSTDGFVGLSPVAVLRESLGIAAAQRDAYGSYLANSPFFNSLLSAPSALTEPQLKDFRAQWQAMQAGQSNAGKTPILWGEWKYLDKTAGMSMADAEFLASRAFENEEICRVFNVPPILIGATDKVSSWGSGIEQINQGFLTYSLNPWLVNWEQALNITLLTERELADGLTVVFDRTALMQASLAARTQFARTMREIGALNNDEVRQSFGYNNIPGGDGAKFQVPFNNQGGVAPSTDAQASTPQQ